MKTIVVGVDGSAAAKRACEVGVGLAANLGAQIVFVHFSPLAGPLLAEDPRDGPSQARLEEADPVLREAADTARARGVPAQLVLQDESGAGMIAAELAGMADGLDAEMTIVGNRGRSQVADVVLGSVSHELLRMSARPVVVVHAGHRPSQGT
jgi:nucleotide-binding universal stress UspA family protein